MYTRYFDHTYSLSPNPPPPLSTQVYIPPFLIHQATLCPYTCGCVPFHWSVADLPGITPQKKTDSSPSSYQSPLTPQLGWDFACLPSPWWDFIWLEYAQVLSMMSQVLWIYVCHCPAVSRIYHFLVVIHLLQLTVFWASLPQQFLSLWRGGVI